MMHGGRGESSRHQSVPCVYLGHQSVRVKPSVESSGKGPPHLSKGFACKGGRFTATEGKLDKAENAEMERAN